LRDKSHIKKLLMPQYRGRLTPAQVADGINAARANAQRLYDDAKLLFEAKRYPSACALASLSIEESGKPALLRRIATAQADDALQGVWREYRTHTAKNSAWMITDLAQNGARTLDDLAILVDQESDHPEVLDALKQLSFYTDCFQGGRWSQPVGLVDEKIAQAIMFAAKVLLGKQAVCTVREIELWIAHVGPLESGRGSKAKLLTFYQAMIAEGLETTPIEAVRKFLGLQLDS
jgi:AbiV family abortive infection protein